MRKWFGKSKKFFAKWTCGMDAERAEKKGVK